MKPLMTLPCKNRHSDMEKREKGYHCKSCNHVLTDFRKSTEEEIQQVLQRNPGKICGVFNQDQFEYKVSHIQVPTFRSVGLSLLGILGFLGPVVTSCDSEPNASEIKQNAFNLLKFPMHVKGTVKDEKTGEIIPHFEVEVLQHGKVIKTVKTDEHGHFDILIRKNDLDQEVFKLAIGGMGYEKDTLTSNIKRFGGSKKVNLTIKAEAKTEIHTLGFIPPKIKQCKPIHEINGYVQEPLEGIPAMDPPPPPEIIESPEPTIGEPIFEQREYVPQEPPVESAKKKERKNRNR